MNCLGHGVLSQQQKVATMAIYNHLSKKDLMGAKPGTPTCKNRQACVRHPRHEDSKALASWSCKKQLFS